MFCKLHRIIFNNYFHRDTRKTIMYDNINVNCDYNLKIGTSPFNMELNFHGALANEQKL